MRLRLGTLLQFEQAPQVLLLNLVSFSFLFFPSSDVFCDYYGIFRHPALLRVFFYNTRWQERGVICGCLELFLRWVSMCHGSGSEEGTKSVLGRAPSRKTLSSSRGRSEHFRYWAHLFSKSVDRRVFTCLATYFLPWYGPSLTPSL